MAGTWQRSAISEKSGTPATSHYIHPKERVIALTSDQPGKIDRRSPRRDGSAPDRAREHNNSISIIVLSSLFSRSTISYGVMKGEWFSFGRGFGVWACVINRLIFFVSLPPFLLFSLTSDHPFLLLPRSHVSSSKFEPEKKIIGNRSIDRQRPRKRENSFQMENSDLADDPVDLDRFRTKFACPVHWTSAQFMSTIL